MHKVNYELAKARLAKATDADVDLIHRALDTLMWVHMGQVPRAFDPLINAAFARATVFQRGDLDVFALRSALETVQGHLTGATFGGPSVFSAEVANEARRALNLCDDLEGGTKIFPEDGSPLETATAEGKPCPS